MAKPDLRSPLTPSLLERAADSVLADAVPVFEHVLTDPAYGPLRTLDTLLDDLRVGRFPSLWVVSKVAGWTLFELQWRSRYRTLSPREAALFGAAQRLWDALDGVTLD